MENGNIGDKVERLESLIERITYRPDYRFVVGTTDGMKYPYIQLKHTRPDCITGEMGEGGSGKAYVSDFASDSEIIQIMLGLAIGYEQHEVREFFLVDGARAYGPHIHVDALISVADQTDARQHVDLNN